MSKSDRTKRHLLFSLVLACSLASSTRAFLNSGSAHLQMLARWCCLNEAEHAKCQDWSKSANVTGPRALNSSVALECVLGADKYDCFRKIFEDKADLMTADAGEVYTAGKFYNLIPIATENYYSAQTSAYTDYYSVAVVKRGSGMTVGSLRGSNSCHGGVGTSSGWNMPISTLIEKQLLEIVDCNNHVKAAAKFFNKMCAPDALNSQFNPTGDNPTSACELCKGKIGTNFCTNQDPYAGSLGAMLCLTEGGGDVAFVKHTTLFELAATNRSLNLNDFELLCPNVYGSPYNTPGPNVNIYPYPTAPIADFAKCNWGVVPARAILTSSRKALVQRRNYRKFLEASAQLFAGQSAFAAPGTLQSSRVEAEVAAAAATTQDPLMLMHQQQVAQAEQSAQRFARQIANGLYDFQSRPQIMPGYQNYDAKLYNQQQHWNQLTDQDQLEQQLKLLTQDQHQHQHQHQLALSSGTSQFFLFDSKLYGARDLIFTDSAVSFIGLDDKITFLSFLPETYRTKIVKLYECPLRLVRWCVISNFEKDKCRLMKNAFASRNIKPDLDCVSGASAWECMSMIKNRLADLITLDPADAYRANRYFGLEPLAAEDYGTMTDSPIYYAVAVVKRTDLSTNLWNLRNKRACGTGFGDMAGWHVPVSYLIGIKELYVTNCHVAKVAGEYFGRSCIPGAMDYNYNTLKTNPRALCLRCYSKGADYCSRSQREYFFGDTGAFRCLTEGEGDVAFVRHTSVQANTDGRNTDQWARPNRQTDFELLCKDGTRKSVEKYAECNMMKVPARLVMVGGHRTDMQRSYLWNMINFAQQLFGSDTNQDFTLFESMKEHPDLIFNDACVQLTPVEMDLSTYLGSDVIEMIHKTDPRICNSSNLLRSSSILLVLVLTAFYSFY